MQDVYRFPGGFKVLMRWHSCLPVESSRIESKTFREPVLGLGSPACNSPIETKSREMLQSLQIWTIFPGPLVSLVFEGRSPSTRFEFGHELAIPLFLSGMPRSRRRRSQRGDLPLSGSSWRRAAGFRCPSTVIGAKLAGAVHVVQNASGMGPEERESESCQRVGRDDPDARTLPVSQGNDSKGGRRQSSSTGIGRSDELASCTGGEGVDLSAPVMFGY